MKDLTEEQMFIKGWNYLAKEVHDTAVEKGWWETERSDGELIALMHSELSEALEGLRHNNPPDDKVSDFTAAEVEFADVVIRMMDAARRRGWRIPEALLAKKAYNMKRSYKHGGKSF